jgi:predicted nucleotidyltransferase
MALARSAGAEAGGGSRIDGGRASVECMSGRHPACYDGDTVKQTAEQAALEELRLWLEERYGARLRELKLFGSRARGEAHEDSDVDVLVVVDGLTSAEARAIAHRTGDLLTVHGVLVSAFAVSTARMTELRERERLIAREIDRDAVPLRR